MHLSVLNLCLAALFFFSGIASAEIPTSSRSENVINKLTPRLKAQLNDKNLEIGSPIFIRIFKRPAVLELWVENQQKTFSLFKQYNICYYSGDLGPKLKQGDHQSLEGFYFVNAGRLNPWSKFHLSFNLGYPNAFDRHHGRTGNYLMVHGDCVSIGCYAMSDPYINEIYTLAHHALDNRQRFFRVHIFPFPLTDKNLSRHKRHDAYEFWLNLKAGYDHFEQNKTPPNIIVNNGRYAVDRSH